MRIGQTSARRALAYGLGALIGGLSLAVTDLASAQDFYQGKTLTVVIASNAGGGTDTSARLIARYWASHIPGKPDIVVRNKPVGVVAANDLHHSTRPDGLTVGVFSGGGTLGPVARKAAAVKYDPLTWGIVGSLERGSSILVVRKDAFNRLNDRRARPVIIGSVSTDRPQDAMALFGAEYLGWNVRFVVGYPSSNEIYLAFERGEIDVFGSGTTKILERFINGGVALPLVAESQRADYPEVPSFEQALGDKKPTGVDWQVFRSWAGPSAVDKFFVVPPGTPAEPLRILQASFKAIEKDPAFAAQAEDILGDGFNIMTGQETAALIRDVLTASSEVVERTNALRKKYGLPQAK